MHPEKQKFIEIFNSLDFHRIKDHPNILIAANFWEEERYEAAKVCYRFMRSIDDLIDNYKASNKTIAPSERSTFEADVQKWLGMFLYSRKTDPLQKELLETIEKFRIPQWPLENFARSMIYDISHDGFATIDDFIEYSQGASVAPASIFVHLNGISGKNGKYEEPPFDVREAATPCAIFSYLVHIVRDFEKDQKNNLNYFADDLLQQNNLTYKDLQNIARGVQPVTEGFREMIRIYRDLADVYRLKTYDSIKQISPLLEPRYQLSLEIIFDLYLMVFERINIESGTFSTAELNPTAEETKERVYKTILRFTN